MKQFYGVGAWLMSSFGVALLVTSLALLPSAPVFSQPHQELRCDGDSTCNEFEENGMTKKCRLGGGGNCTTHYDCKKNGVDQCKGCTCNDNAQAGDCKCEKP
jgi:hypothetical protein